MLCWAFLCGPWMDMFMLLCMIISVRVLFTFFSKRHVPWQIDVGTHLTKLLTLSTVGGGVMWEFLKYLWHRQIPGSAPVAGLNKESWFHWQKLNSGGKKPKKTNDLKDKSIFAFGDSTLYTPLDIKYKKLKLALMLICASSKTQRSSAYLLALMWRHPGK